ncbi:MAG: flagellar basal-body rod protein FlgG [Planctomycetes bacterium]|nr:flagellar basal-body rod protein FlgG [Planctomycetota bacterium]
MKALYTAGTGMKAQQMTVDVIANNLANANTAGFKRSQIDFQDLLYDTIERPGVQTSAGIVSPTGLQIGAGSHAASTTKVFSQGAVEETRRDLDVAIQGDGFFQITLPDGGTGYTRDGSFRLDAGGNLVNVDGYPLSPGITIPQDAISISIGKDGTVSAVLADDPTGSSEVGQLTLARFPNPAGLSSEGGNIYRETPSSGSPVEGPAGIDGKGVLMQRFLERSNVEVVTELVRLIVAQRAYEVNSKAIRTGDEMLSTANTMTR